MSESRQPQIERRGLLLVLSSPSGAGKTTLAKRLAARDGEIVTSVSVTTRPPRASEVDGRDYHFIDTARYRAMQAAGELLEGAEIFGNLYGTPRAPVMAAIAGGRDVLFDIDWQGARQLAGKVSDDLVRVFILPPSAAALAERLRGRNQDAPEVVARRLREAPGEISHWDEYDYVLVNSDLDACFERVTTILAAERLRRRRQSGLGSFVEGLLGDLKR